MRRRLIFSFALVVVVSILSVVLIGRQGTAREVRAFMVRGGMAGMEGVVNDLELYYRTFGTWQGAGNLLDVSNSNGSGTGSPGMGGMMRQRLRLADVDGVVVADTTQTISGEQLSAAEIAQSILLENDGKTVGYLLPEGGMGIFPNAPANLVNRLNFAMLPAAVLAGAFSLILALGLSYGLLRPVRDLTQAARNLAQGDLSQRVAVRGGDELATLGSSFNQMAESLQQAEELRRAMTADIAHELRNPLAVQRANLEALQDGVYPLTVENLQPILEQNQLLIHLVEDLRTLSLADAGQLTLECTPTNLMGLLQRVVDQFRLQSIARQIEMVFDPDPHNHNPLILVDPMRIEQVLSNLLSNALRYTPDGGQIECQVTAIVNSTTYQTTHLALTIRDSGPGIPEDVLPQLFERFYRADKSRSRMEGGTGLGLAIARQLVEAHGGTLTVANHPMGGAAFTLRLPVGDIKA